jgi:hypothetical protein
MMFVEIVADFHIQFAQFYFSPVCQPCHFTPDFSNFSLICDKQGFYFPVLQS